MAGGCVPFALPPGQASIGSASTGVAQRSRSRDEEAPHSIRLGVHPLGLWDSHQTRTLDLGAGYAFERVVRREGQLGTQGPYLELGAYPLRTATALGTVRAGLRTTGDLLMSDQGTERAGFGGSVALAVEVASFASGPFGVNGSDGAIAGLAHGEVGLGGFVGVSHRRFVDDAYWVASAGISLRLPAAVGVVCCVKP
jgi:hypothetical protein